MTGPPNQRATRVFAEAKNKLEASLGETPRAGFSFVSQQQQSGAARSEKLDQMVRASVSELIDSFKALPARGQLPKASLLEFLSEIPPSGARLRLICKGAGNKSWIPASPSAFQDRR